MTLEQKAKTGREICDSIMEFYKGLGANRLDGKLSISLEEFKRRELEKWVRFEYHQQEIDKLKHFEGLYIKNIQRLERKRSLRKQKLQQIAVEVENLRRHNQYSAETDKWQIPQRQLFALEKEFEELLKE